MLAQKPYVLAGAQHDHIQYVASNMRTTDRAEAACFGLDPVLAAPNLVACSKDVYTAFCGETPAFIFGTVELVPGVRQLFGFGTPKTKRVMPAVTWFTEEYWLPEMFENGVRRIQVHVPITHKESVSWLESFGMFRECEMHDYSVDGTPMLQLAYTRKEFQIECVSVEARAVLRQ